MKLSIHRDGNCQFGFDNRLVQALRGTNFELERGRMIRWQRQQTPDRGAVHVASLLFPSKLNQMVNPSPDLKKPVYWFEPAPENKAIEILIYYSYEPPLAAAMQAAAVGELLFWIELAGKNIVYIVNRTCDWDAKFWLDLQYRFESATTKPLSTTAMLQPGETLPDVAMIVCDEPKDNEAIHIIELTGLSLQSRRALRP